MLQSNVEWKYLNTHTSQQKTERNSKQTMGNLYPSFPNAMFYCIYHSLLLELQNHLYKNVQFYETHYSSKCHVITLVVLNPWSRHTTLQECVKVVLEGTTAAYTCNYHLSNNESYGMSPIITKLTNSKEHYVHIPCTRFYLMQTITLKVWIQIDLRPSTWLSLHGSS
jgi:hypothetical protein